MSRRRTSVLGALCALGAGLLSVAPIAMAAGGVGSRYGGDDYFPLDGNRGYQVEHYRIVDSYDIRKDHLVGRTRLRMVARKDLSVFHLDLALTPTRVRVDGVKATYSKPNAHELRITPATPIRAGSTVHVSVRYAGDPGAAKAEGIRPFLSSGSEGVAIGEPQIGPWWFAANETPVDKATYDIVVRVPKGRQAISNGELVDKSVVRAGGRDWTRWHWRMTDPMATYLAFFAAGRFQVERGTVNGRPYFYAVSKGLDSASGARAESMDLLRETPGVVSWLEGQFGDYPFTSIGGVVTSLYSGFALENQSRPVYPYAGGPEDSLLLVVHEQAHQWFGDSVTVRRWKDVWLNEGLATYAEWLYTADHGGVSVEAELQSQYAARSGSFWNVEVGDPGPDLMWSNAVYVRGAMTIAALRNRIGATEVETLLHRWADEHSGGHGTRAEFEALAQEVSGVDLEGFFAHWLDDEGQPAATTENGLA